MTGRTSKNKTSTIANTDRLVLVSLPPPSPLPLLLLVPAAPRGPMADRIPYSMIPNYSPALIHQQQQAQQQHQIQPQQQQPQQQQQQQDAFPDNSRIWSHSQMRSHPPDLATIQSNPQVRFPPSPFQAPVSSSLLSLRIFFACVPKHSLSFNNFLNTPPSKIRLSNRSPSTPT